MIPELEILQNVKIEIEKQLCPIHNQSPTLEFIDNAISIKACCEEFRLQSVELSKEEYGKKMHEFMKSKLSSIFQSRIQ